MLTPAKIKNHHFEVAGRNSYKADSVDTFLEEVADSYDKMFQENGEMFKKLNLLAERLEEYRKDEDNIRNALLDAQRTAGKVISDAKEKADEMIAEVTERTTNDHARIDAEIAEKTNAANMQIQTMLAEAQAQAEKIIDDATRDSKEAAIRARDNMIKEEAALDTMKQEVTKFKKLLLDKYSEQVALVESLPEFIYEQAAKEEAEKAAAEQAKAEEEAVVEEAVVEEQIEETAEEEIAVPAMAEVDETAFEEADEIDVSRLQEMIADDEEKIEDDYAEIVDEPIVEETFEAESDDADLVLPEVDEASEEYLNKIVDDYATDEDTAETGAGDIMFTKRTRTDSLDESEAKMRAKVEANAAEFEDKEDGGFTVNLDKLDSYSDDDDFLNELDDEDDDLDDDDGESLASKFKGFFKK